MKIFEKISDWWDNLSYEAEQMIIVIGSSITTALVILINYKLMRKAVRSELGEIFKIRGFFKKK